MKATMSIIYAKCLEWGFTETQEKKKNSVRTLISYFLDDGLIHKTNERLGREYYYEFESWDVLEKWISRNKVPQGYIALKKADDYGITYFTARNRCISRGITMNTYGFGSERKIYIKESDFREITSKVVL